MPDWRMMIPRMRCYEVQASAPVRVHRQQPETLCLAPQAEKGAEALPLFADQIAASQPSEDDVMQSRAKAWAAHEDRDRAERAAKWRQARQRLSVMSPKECRILRRAWNCAPYPADPVYLLGFLHSYDVGRFTLDSLPFPLTRTDPHGRVGIRRQPADELPRGDNWTAVFGSDNGKMR